MEHIPNTQTDIRIGWKYTVGNGEIKLNPTQEIIIYFNIKIFMIYVKKYANIIWDISKTTNTHHK